MAIDVTDLIVRNATKKRRQHIPKAERRLPDCTVTGCVRKMGCCKKHVTSIGSTPLSGPDAVTAER